jgi:putative membrane protein (TIGR04086 family)
MKSEFKVLKSGGFERNRFTALLSGILIAYAITCIFFIGCALALTYTSLSEDAVPVIMMIAVAVSVVVAGYDAAKSAVKNGWLWGMAAGLIYAVILICIETWVSDGFAVDAKTIVSIALSLAGGCFGGVLGINISRK